MMFPTSFTPAGYFSFLWVEADGSEPVWLRCSTRSLGETQWILTLQDGFAFTIGRPTSTVAGFACDANVMKGQNLYKHSEPHEITQFLNPAAFANPPVATQIAQTDYSPLDELKEFRTAMASDISDLPTTSPHGSDFGYQAQTLDLQHVRPFSNPSVNQSQVRC
jgi:hypothetical protein